MPTSDGLARPDCIYQTSKPAVHGLVCDLEYAQPSRLDREADGLVQGVASKRQVMNSH